MDLNTKQLEYSTYVSVAEILDRNLIVMERPEIQEMDGQLGGLINWLLKTYEQYDCQLRKERLIAELENVSYHDPKLDNERT